MAHTQAQAQINKLINNRTETKRKEENEREFAKTLTHA